MIGVPETGRGAKFRVGGETIRIEICGRKGLSLLAVTTPPGQNRARRGPPGCGVNLAGGQKRWRGIFLKRERVVIRVPETGERQTRARLDYISPGDTRKMRMRRSGEEQPRIPPLRGRDDNLGWGLASEFSGQILPSREAQRQDDIV